MLCALLVPSSPPRPAGRRFFRPALGLLGCCFIWIDRRECAVGGVGVEARHGACVVALRGKGDGRCEHCGAAREPVCWV